MHTLGCIFGWAPAGASIERAGRDGAGRENRRDRIGGRRELVFSGESHRPGD
jgi:hypothetical protein